MKRRSLLGGALALTAGVSSAYAQDITFFRIVTGGTVGTYFPIGGLIANAVSSPPRLVLTAQASNGSVANVNGIVSGALDFAILEAPLRTGGGDDEQGFERFW